VRCGDDGGGDGDGDDDDDDDNDNNRRLQVAATGLFAVEKTLNIVVAGGGVRADVCCVFGDCKMAPRIVRCEMRGVRCEVYKQVKMYGS
jgi:hypothetical protein